MIVIFSPYPYEPLRQDGMYRRILEIDNHVFKDEERFYIYYSPQGEDYRIQEPFLVDTNAYVQLLDFHYTAHHLKLREYINRAQLVYAQTMIYSSPYLSAYYSTGKIITDAHGIASEEERMVNRHSRGRLMDIFEKQAARYSRAVVVVTEAMAEYYRKNFNCESTEFIHIPICSVLQEQQDWPIKERKTVIYAGGLHVWQNVDLMLDIAEKKSDLFDFVFLTNEIDVFKDKLKDRHFVSPVKVASVEHDEINKYLSQAEYGLLLRDDTPVNNVAFPTKLIEYLANGVIPIVKSVHVGDYVQMGVRGISIDDFLTGNLPSSDIMKDMMRHNFKCYQQVFVQYENGLHRLKELVAELKTRPNSQTNDAEALPVQYRTTFLPLNIECSYKDTDGIKMIMIDAGDTPLSIRYLFEKEKKITDLRFTITGKQFVFNNCVLLCECVNKTFTLPLRNSNDFQRDRYSNLIYTNNMQLIFSYKEIHCMKSFILKLDIFLYDVEIGTNSKSITEKKRLIQKLNYSLKHESLMETCKRSFRFIRKKIHKYIYLSGKHIK